MGLQYWQTLKPIPQPRLACPSIQPLILNFFSLLTPTIDKASVILMDFLHFYSLFFL